MDKILDFFIPREKKFYHFISNSSRNALSSAVKLQELMDRFSSLSPDEFESRLNEISEIEKKGDALTQEISRALYNTFVTPIDREDIHELVSLIDDETDLILDLSKKLAYYKLSSIPDLMKRQMDLCRRQLEEICLEMEKLESKCSIDSHPSEILRLREEGDSVYGQAISKLFSEEKDPIEIIKLKDLHETFRRLADKNQSVSIVFENIVIKHA